MYVGDHCQAQELSNDLPVSYEMQEIFCGGSALPLKIKAGLYIRGPTPSNTHDDSQDNSK